MAMDQATVGNLPDWGSLLTRAFVNFRVESARPSDFRGSMKIRSISGIDFIEMRTGEHVAHRGADDIRLDPRPNFLVCLLVAGAGEFLQDGRTALMRPGDITVFDTSQPTTVVSSRDYRNLCMLVPQTSLGIPAATMRQLTATRFAADDGMTPAARTVLRTLDDVVDTLPARSRHRVAHTAVDVMATLFESALGLPDARSGRSGELLFDRVNQFIDRHLSDPELSPGVLATTHYVSLRHLHAVFGASGTTVSASILARRLERARRDLVDPALRELPAVVVGSRNGFATASSFGRAFKHAFGTSPAAYRSDFIN